MYYPSIKALCFLVAVHWSWITVRGFMSISNLTFKRMYRESKGLNLQPLHTGFISLHILYQTGLIVGFFISTIKSDRPINSIVMTEEQLIKIYNAK